MTVAAALAEWLSKIESLSIDTNLGYLRPRIGTLRTTLTEAMKLQNIMIFLQGKHP